MTVAEAREISPMTFIGGDQFETVADGIEYNFGVTPVGRIYRVQSTQRLGQFQVDRSFLETLRSQLSAKYGEPDSAIGDTFHWELIEPVTHRDGQRLQFRTMWMSAYIGHQDRDASLEMTLIDFRILWHDQDTAGLPNRQEAESRIRF